MRTLARVQVAHISVRVGGELHCTQPMRAYVVALDF
jgi:hypothetical protein